MAKRKRLAPAKSEYLAQTGELETKSPLASPAPIAQVAGEASAVSALTELSKMVNDARSEGRFIQTIGLDDIDLSYLVRDRISADEDELEALVSSLRDRGQQTAIEVVDLGADQTPRYGLISGWRRICALRRLAQEDAKFNTVQALLRTPEALPAAYVAMVEENEVRVGLSFYERARIVVKALDEGVYPDAKAALLSLYRNVPRAKRSKIKSFMTVVDALDGVLQFPSSIGERLGLELARYCQDHGPAQLVAALQTATVSTALEEQDALRAAMAPSTKPKPQPPIEQGRKAKFDSKNKKIVITGADDALYAALEQWLSEQPL